jgi:hypothetical protein
MKIDTMTTKLESAKAAIARAEEDLEAAMREIRGAPRAEKVAIGQVLERAFAALRDAKAELVIVEVGIAKGGHDRS